MRFVKTLVLGIMLAAAAVCGLRAQDNPVTKGVNPTTPGAVKAALQGKPAAQAPAKPTSTSAAGQNKPAAPVSAKPGAPGAKPAPSAANSKSATPAAKPTAKHKGTKSVARSPKAAPSAASSTQASDKEPKVAKRDPFEALVGHDQSGGQKTGPLPAGKAGLQVSTLRLDGIVRAPNGMIAVVSNPQARTYFLREGDQLYDGRVEKIAMDGVSFHEIGKDAFGKPVERQVNKRIYASAGEQQ